MADTDEAFLKGIKSKLKGNQKKAVNRWGHTNKKALMDGISISDLKRLKRLSGGNLTRVLENRLVAMEKEEDSVINRAIPFAVKGGTGK